MYRYDQLSCDLCTVCTVCTARKNGNVEIQNVGNHWNEKIGERKIEFEIAISYIPSEFTALKVLGIHKMQNTNRNAEETHTFIAYAFYGYPNTEFVRSIVS